ncbi:hypothetical protein C5167_045962 [Papaver somniferum]|uniref:YDG domain-containing protein n=1 Tax=Papaver somniferum TaxID=3469 RepID=A0A4Y7LD78_PAPSO|nr:hypothetical protein C5167_045962 [Papaver somniferum]
MEQTEVGSSSSEPQRTSELNYPQNNQNNGTANQDGGSGFGYNNNVDNGASPSYYTPPPAPRYNAENGDTTRSRKSSSTRGDSVVLISESEEDGYSNSKKRTANYLSSMDIQESGSSQRSRSRPKKIKPNPDLKFMVPANGDRETVNDLLLKFDALRRKLAQIEDTKEVTAGIKRADLKAGTLMFNYGLRTNAKKIVGIVPGIEIGDIYFFRMEMCLVGLHAPVMAGIDYMSLKIDQEDETLAVSIVSSGGYEDDAEYGDVLIYSGQGGAANKKEGKEASDQKLERGNLALERSLRRGNDVRTSRVMDREREGGDQCLQLWRDNTVSRPGVILPDLTSGTEKLEVFKTQGKGWGLRSWDPIRAGTFVCEYAGQVVELSRVDVDEDDEYIFNAARSFDKNFKWNYLPEILEEEKPTDPDELRNRKLNLYGTPERHYRKLVGSLGTMM